MTDFRGAADGAGRRFAVVASRFNELVTERLLDGAVACLREHGVAEDDIDVVRVPGAWELPAATARVLARGGYDGVVAVGCVIRGETPHFEFVAGAATDGLGELARGAVPLGFGLLTTDTSEQALARAGGDTGNKGWEAALAALEMAQLYRSLGGR